MKKITITILNIFLVAAYSINVKAQTLGERVQVMQHGNAKTTTSKNKVYSTTRNRNYYRDGRVYDRDGNNGKHKGWYKHDNGKHKGWYKNNNGHGKKHN